MPGAPAHDIETTCLELLGAAGENRRARASVLAELGWARALQGRLDEGIQVASGGRDALAELGVVAWLGSATLACGYIELLRGDVARAELEFAHAQRTFVALDDEWSVVEAVVQRALALCALGRHAEAPDACDSPRTPDEPDWVINWNRVHALVHAAQGAYEPALAHADTAVRAAQPTEYLNFHAAALADRATILEQLGREAEALSDLRGSIVLYDQKGNVIDRDRVRRRLEARIAHDTHR